MTWYREWFGEDYLELYSHRDAEEARRHAAFFRQRAGDIQGPILDVACGTGRHIDELRQLGCSVVGCDLSFTLLRRGLEEYGAMRLARADMRSLPFRSASFGALVNFFTSFGYFESPEEDRETTREMVRVLRPGAPFLFDYLNVQREVGRLVGREEKLVDGAIVLIERWFDTASRTINKRITIGSKHYLERVRGYSRDEITALFDSSGFAIHDIFGDFHGAPFSDESPRLILSGTRRP